MRTISVGGLKLGEGHFFFIGGPCVIESEVHCTKIAKAIKEITSELRIPFVFKTSYDKANRLSYNSYRGPGLVKGLRILENIKRKLGIAILSDAHSTLEVKLAAKVLDIIQIPAFLSRQTDLVTEAAKTGRAINIKKGQFLAPWDMKNIIAKIERVGNRKILLTERGTTFGYNNLVSDMRAIPIMREFGYPVVYDAGHSSQLPGGHGDRSGGQREMIPTLAYAACAAGCDGLFIEVHDHPDKAPSDGPNMLKLSDLHGLLKKAKAIHSVVLDGQKV